MAPRPRPMKKAPHPPAPGTEQLTGPHGVTEPAPGIDVATQAGKAQKSGPPTTAKTDSTTPSTRKRASSNTAVKQPTPAKKMKQATKQKATAAPSSRRTTRKSQAVTNNSAAEQDIAAAENTDSDVAADLVPKPKLSARAVRDGSKPKEKRTLVADNQVLDPQGEAEDDASGKESDTPSAPGVDDDDNVYQSASEDGLNSDDSGALGAQLEAEKATWTKPSRRNRPPTFDDIGVPRSEKSRKLTGLPRYVSSSSGTGSEFEPDDDEGSEEDDPDTLDEDEMLKTLKDRKVREKASKAVPPLLGPLRDEQPVWKLDPSVQSKKAWEDVIKHRAACQKGQVRAKLPTSSKAKHPVAVHHHFDNEGSTGPVSEGSDIEDGENSSEAEVDLGENIPDVLAPQSYVIKRPSPGAAISLIKQHPHIAATARATFPRLEVIVAFEDPFPDAVKLQQVTGTELIEAARQRGYTGLQVRFQTDATFLRPLCAIPKQRISTFRGGIKKQADTHVIAFYGLQAGKADSLVFAIKPHLGYIYPFTFESDTNKLTVPWSKPMGHPIVAAMLRACFFNGASSLGALNLDRFTSSLDNRPDEREVPVPMLALVCTAIHAALSEWQTGMHKPAPFSADSYLDVYNEHTILLTGIKQKNIRAYHTLMHRLYKAATGTMPAAAAAAAANDALAQVDLDAMDVD